MYAGMGYVTQYRGLTRWWQLLRVLFSVIRTGSNLHRKMVAPPSSPELFQRWKEDTVHGIFSDGEEQIGNV